MLKKTLPTLYLKFFPKSLLDFNIKETRATCENCALRPGASPDKRNYHPNLKCCTFHPYQTNYLLGQILSSKSTPKEVLNRIYTKIENREYVLPIGIAAPTLHQTEFTKNKEKYFGKKEEWLCPYYDREKNNCGIWKARSSVCTSFHCLSNYGKAGFEFWDKLSNYISFVEMALMEEVLLKLKFSPLEISEQTHYLNRTKLLPKEKPPLYFSEEYSKTIWKGYYPDQTGFYKKCYQIVSDFSPYQFKKALGEMGLSIQKELLDAGKEIMKPIFVGNLR